MRGLSRKELEFHQRIAGTLKRLTVEAEESGDYDALLSGEGARAIEELDGWCKAQPWWVKLLGWFSH